MLVYGLGDRYNEIKWDKHSDRHSRFSRTEDRAGKASKAFQPFNIIPDEFPLHVQGKEDIQSGIILTCRSEYKRKLKEKGLVQV